MIPDTLSVNFKRHEFRCNGTKCCGNSFPVMPDLIKVLQAIRHKFGVPIFVSSGFRCNTFNAIVDGSSDSWHTIGGAADCRLLLNHSSESIFDFAQNIPELGAFGFYDNHFHVDVRPRVAGKITVWNKRR